MNDTQLNDFGLLMQEIRRGMDGRNDGLEMGFPKLNNHVGIRKRIYTLIIGSTGSGKSSFASCGYILNPFDYWYSHRAQLNLSLKIPYFSMERSKVYTLAKWASQKIFRDQGVLIPIGKMMGWGGYRLSANEHDLIQMYGDYFGELLEVVDIIEGAKHPTAVYSYLKELALKRGREEQLNEYKSLYLPDDPSEIILPIIDHIGLTRVEKNLKTKKDAIDRLSENLQHARDYYGYSPVVVAQLNRDLSNPMYMKQDSFEPNLDQAKESGRPAEDCDVAISLFDPLRFKTNDASYHDVKVFQNQENGAKYFRSIKILKNTYGADDLRLGMAFMGSTGYFKELPKARDMGVFDYNSLFTGQYFRD